MTTLDWKLEYKDFEITREKLNFKWTHSVSNKKYFFPYEYKAVNVYSGSVDDNGNPRTDEFWNGEDRIYGWTLKEVKNMIYIYHKHYEEYKKYKKNMERSFKRQNLRNEIEKKGETIPRWLELERD